MATRRSRSTVGTGGGRPPPVTRWMWKRSHGRTSEAPPDERGGYRYVRPTATAPHLDSTQPLRSLWLRRRAAHRPLETVWATTENGKMGALAGRRYFETAAASLEA